MRSESIVLNIDSNTRFMLKEFVEHGGIEYYEHHETLYRLLDKIADETVRTHSGENLEMQEDIKNIIWEYCKPVDDPNNNRTVRHQMIVDTISKKYRELNEDTEFLYYNIDRAITWMIAKKCISVAKVTNDLYYRFNN